MLGDAVKGVGEPGLLSQGQLFGGIRHADVSDHDRNLFALRVRADNDVFEPTTRYRDPQDRRAIEMREEAYNFNVDCAIAKSRELAFVADSIRIVLIPSDNTCVNRKAEAQ